MLTFKCPSSILTNTSISQRKKKHVLKQQWGRFIFGHRCRKNLVSVALIPLQRIILLDYPLHLLTRTLLYTKAVLSPSVLKNTGFDSLTTLNKLYTDRCTWSERRTAPAPVRWPSSPDKSQQQLRMSCCQQWRCTWRCRVCLPSVDKTPSAWCRHSQSAECWRSLLTLPERRTWACWELGTQWRQRGQTQTGSGTW